MSGLAMVFPGQGSQSVGMLAAWQGSSQAVRDTIAQADEVLAADLSGLVANGPAEQLDLTVNTQPAMLLVDICLWRAWLEAGGPRPAVVAGHSLGEYAALVAAEVLGFEDALRLVRQRAQWMQQAVSPGAGAMAAIIGLSDERVMSLCTEQAQTEVLQAVNFNAPGQIVVAGHAAAVERATVAAKAAGARLAKTLPVSVPAHCALMAPAGEALREALASIEVCAPQIPVLHNLDGSTCSEPAAIREALAQQVMQPVQWVQTQQRMRDDYAISTGLECGPGQVLCGLAKRSVPEVSFQSLATPEKMQQQIERVSGR